MNAAESVFLWLSVLGYILAFVAMLIGMVFGKDRAAGAGSKLTVGTFALHTLAIISRWIATGHMPVMGVYENSLLGAWFVVFVFLVSGRWITAKRTLAVIVVPIALIMLGNGIMRGAELEPLSPAFQSNWLFVFYSGVSGCSIFMEEQRPVARKPGRERSQEISRPGYHGQLDLPVHHIWIYRGYGHDSDRLDLGAWFMGKVLGLGPN
jgi:hypothetical protein